MISNFEADVKYLHDPYLTLSNIEKVPQLNCFYKWGAMFFVIVAIFSSLIRRIKLIFIYIRIIKPSAEPILQYLNEDFEFSDECSSDSSNDEELKPTVSSRDQQIDFSVKGQKSILRFRRRRSSYELFPLTEFVAGKSVVKLWDFTVPSPAMVFPTEGREDNNGVVFAAYDVRTRGESPVICGEWATGKVVGIDGIEKVYVRDEVAGIVKVGDMRKVKMPVEIYSNGDRL